MNNLKNGKKLAHWLGILQIFIAILAVPAGISMIIDPSGSQIGIPLETLANSPVSDFLIPGIFLLMVIGIGSLLGGIASFHRFKLAGEIAIGLGAFLIAWIVVQFYWIGFHWLQVLYFILGILELILGLILRKREE